MWACTRSRASDGSAMFAARGPTARASRWQKLPTLRCACAAGQPEGHMVCRPRGLPSPPLRMKAPHAGTVPSTPRADRGSAAQRVAVIGTGYVGLVTAACLADLGHRVVGVDSDAPKVRALEHDRVPIHEPGLE